MAAQFALTGLELVKGDPEVRGQARYYVVCEFTMKPLADLEAAREYLDRVHRAYTRLLDRLQECVERRDAAFCQVAARMFGSSDIERLAFAADA